MTQQTDPVHVLLIGGGGREHALARAISRSKRLGKLFVTHPENPGLGELGTPVDVPVSDKELYRLGQFCDREHIGLVVIGPEDPLAAGWADTLRKRGDGGERAVFGPERDGAQLEADKGFCKRLLRAATIPTGEGRVFTDPEMAEEYYRTRDEPMVVKATGLAKGKGVVVPATIGQGMDAIKAMMRRGAFGDAGKSVLIEEKLTGTEVSVLALVDGGNIFVLPPCQDHKRLGDHDEGPNTGGMGAFCPSGTISDSTMRMIESEVLVPMVDALRREEIEFRGVLYAGLMLTAGGPKVLEFNVRFGDPECQSLMARLDSDAIELLMGTATGRLDEAEIRFVDDVAVTVVLASKGYPGSPRMGDEITGVDEAVKLEGVTVDHAGTRLEGGRLVTAGGRVLAVTALGSDLATARSLAYEACALISFDGMQLRHDIGASAVHAKG